MRDEIFGIAVRAEQSLLREMSLPRKPFQVHHKNPQVNHVDVCLRNRIERQQLRKTNSKSAYPRQPILGKSLVGVLKTTNGEAVVLAVVDYVGILAVVVQVHAVGAATNVKYSRN